MIRFNVPLNLLISNNRYTVHTVLMTAFMRRFH